MLPSNKFWRYKENILRWVKFFYDIDKDKKILDYGTGPGWAYICRKKSEFIKRYPEWM